ncbi:MAG: N-acetyltransferase family protein [Gaiellaceae bacterium]
MSVRDDVVVDGAPIALRDGSHVRIRQGRRSDRELLLRGFRRLSSESRYRRFLAPMPRLPEATVRHLTDIDHHDHEAMIALDEQGTEALGVARYVRDPERPDAAEVAVTVVDDRQGRGLGTLLLEAVSARAREEGVRTFTAWMLARNQEMMDLFQRLGPVQVVDRDAGAVEIEVAIPDAGVAPELRELLRLAAKDDVAVPVTRRDGRQTTL